IGRSLVRSSAASWPPGARATVCCSLSYFYLIPWFSPMQDGCKASGRGRLLHLHAPPKPSLPEAAPGPAQPSEQGPGDPEGPGQHGDPIGVKGKRNHPRAGKRLAAAILKPASEGGGRAVAGDLHVGKTHEALVNRPEEDAQGDQGPK